MLYLHDINGKDVYSEYISPFTSIKNINLSSILTPGIYAVRLVFGSSNLTGKFLIK
jgi:hypothetical protein